MVICLDLSVPIPILEFEAWIQLRHLPWSSLKTVGLFSDRVEDLLLHLNLQFQMVEIIHDQRQSSMALLSCLYYRYHPRMQLESMLILFHFI